MRKTASWGFLSLVLFLYLIFFSFVCTVVQESSKKIGILQNLVARKKQSSAMGHSPTGAKPSITGEKEGVGSGERKRQRRLPKLPTQKPQP